MSQSFTGPRAIFKIQGVEVAYASSVNYNIAHDHQPIETLDHLAPIEYAEVGYKVDFSCNTFRVAGRSAIALGIQPKLENILVQPELVVELQDRIKQITILRITGVKLTGRTGSVDARGVGTESWNFVGLRASDEAGD
ncbi:MAG TPA: hypothetical protein PLJ37_01110 [Chitinophagales bacterium]|nr:hypothetical protein [Chitinophagales bacterium]HMW93425.1 hypothetical protein [Chitinophagales bacterium]HMZ92952.1 hypothetical protein [Chitinophagales bacterium]HNG25984.1 hypothetical protein [Chitinophagales bacterium]